MAVFTNTTLEGYFKRIANATRSLCGLSSTLTLKQIHTALLSKSGLSRKTTPVTPGDYLKGIAVCARKINGRSDYLTGSCTLAEIATCLENPKVEDQYYTFTHSCHCGEEISWQVNDTTFTYPETVTCPSCGCVYSCAYDVLSLRDPCTGEGEGGGVTKYGVTVTLYSSGELTVVSDGQTISFYTVTLYNSYGQIASHYDLYGSSHDFSADLAAQGNCYAVVTVYFESGDSITITSNTVEFM